MSDLHPLTDGPRTQAAVRPRQDTGLSGILRVVSAAQGRGKTATVPLPSQDWDALVGRVHDAGRRAREVEEQSRDREMRVEEILLRVREDIEASNERVRAAEARVREVQTRADAQVLALEERVKAADARARAAEERAQAAEAWLARVQDAIAAEFADFIDTPAA